MNVIKTPKNFKNLNVKVLKNETFTQKLQNSHNKVISCKNARLNYYFNQNTKYQTLLASHGWRNNKSKGDNFKIIQNKQFSYFDLSNIGFNPNKYCFEDNGHILQEKFGENIFDKIDPRLINILEKNGIKSPTMCQTLGISNILTKQNTLLTAETGSGKTFSYLLPILHRNLIYKKTWEQACHRYLKENHLTLQNILDNNIIVPYCLVLVPTKELCHQLTRTLELFRPTLHLNTMEYVFGNIKTQYSPSESVNGPDVKTPFIDVCISIPNHITQSLVNVQSLKATDNINDIKREYIKNNTKKFDISLTQHIVFDEMDTLFDDSFRPATQTILDQTKTESQLILVGATKPKYLNEILNYELKNGNDKDFETQSSPHDSKSIYCVQTKNVHRVLPHVVQKFIRLLKHEKMAYVTKELQKGLIPPKSKEQHKSMSIADKQGQNKIEYPKLPITLVFCQSYEICEKIYQSLKIDLKGWTYFDDEKQSFTDIADCIACFHGKLDSHERQIIYQRFFRFFPHDKDGIANKNHSPINILISTDLMSRGLDTIHVDRVINYDFPKYLSDYIHRVGRVGRCKSPTQLDDADTISRNAPKDVNNIVLNLISTKHEAELVQQIEESIRKNLPLHNVNANIKRRIGKLMAESGKVKNKTFNK